jgi:hypothetical protein
VAFQIGISGDGLAMRDFDTDILGEVPGSMTVYRISCTAPPMCTGEGSFRTVRVAGTPASPVSASHSCGDTSG